MLSKFQNMLPRLNHNFNGIPSSINEIFNARQIYISDSRITPEYIKYIRPINEQKEKRHKKKFLKNKTKIDLNIFKKRTDQYDFNTFCKMALNETLIDNKTMEYDNDPIISVVLPSYNKQNILLKSIRSIQNQNFKNIEIIIVNDCSIDNSSLIFDYLLKTDKRIRIFHHMNNLGVFRSRIDGILYSKGKYIIEFDTGDFYEDNYVLTDAYNIIKKYNLDSCKFIFRIVENINNLSISKIPYHIETKAKIEYGPRNIRSLNHKIFLKTGNIWNRLVRANIYIKGILLLNELMLNVYKNFWDDIWFNDIINMVSNSYAIFERVGYVYYNNGKGEGTAKYETREQKSNIIREYLAFLYFDYNFCVNNECKAKIIRKLKYYNGKSRKKRLKNLISHFGILNNLLEALIKDPKVNDNDKEYCKKLLSEYKIREKQISIT